MSRNPRLGAANPAFEFKGQQIPAAGTVPYLQDYSVVAAGPNRLIVTSENIATIDWAAAVKTGPKTLILVDIDSIYQASATTWMHDWLLSVTSGEVVQIPDSTGRARYAVSARVAFPEVYLSGEKPVSSVWLARLRV